MGDATNTTSGALPTRKDTVRAEVLLRALMGEPQTGLAAVFGAHTTRLAAVVHALSKDYGWDFTKIDKTVATKDGRVEHIREYRLAPEVIAAAMRSGAATWCAEVKVARAALRRKADEAER
ncbi:MAG: hypothetical protein KGL43_06325, partial [Burkholderiales bacterium]|nr:hypothetical protein [Burkholderiales bacterium]